MIALSYGRWFVESLGEFMDFLIVFLTYSLH